VSDISIDASTTTDLPTQARMQVGYPSMQASFTLKGDVDQADATKTAQWFFGAYSVKSPFYRRDALKASVFIDILLYPSGAGGVPEVIRKFTGFIDDYTEAPDGAVAFTCIDGRSLLRSITSLPAVVTAPPYNAGLTSEFALDYIVRAATKGEISTWPQQRPNCVLAVGLRSSLWPEVGTLSTGNPVAPLFRPMSDGHGTGLNTTQAITSPGLNSLPNYQLAQPVGTDLFIEVRYDTADVGSGPLGQIMVCVDPTATATNGRSQEGIEFSWTAGGSGSVKFHDQYGNTNTASFAFTAKTGYLSATVALPLSGSNSWSAIVTDGQATVGSGTKTASNPRASATWGMGSLTASGVTFYGVQVTTESDPTLVDNAHWTPLAILDQSLNALQYVPPVTGDPWAAIQQICDAEFGVAGFDESMIFRFKNRVSIRTAPVARSLTSAASLSSLGIETLSAAVINRAQISCVPGAFKSQKSIVWALSTQIFIAAHSTVTIPATTSTLGYNPDLTISLAPDGGITNTTSQFRASLDKAGTTKHPNPPTFTVAQTAPDTLAITATNNSNQGAWLVSADYVADSPLVPAGTPFLQLAAYVVTPGDTVAADFQYPAAVDGGAASSRFGEVVYQASDNPWLQDYASAYQLAQDLVLASYTPKRNLTNVTILPDPRLQLIDTVHIQDPDVTGADDYGRIYGWTLAWPSGGEPSMTIDARTIAATGAWIGGFAGRSEGNLTTYAPHV
jgi:hypothetical protein